MEKGVSGATSFSDIDLNAPQSNFTEYLEIVCPYFIHFGMTWDDFWYGSLDRLGAYWQANQFSIERRNQELWLQGMYIQEAVGAVLDSKHRVKYPDKPYRITEMTEAEREAENRRKVVEMRNALMAHKQRWDSIHKGVGA